MEKKREKQGNLGRRALLPETHLNYANDCLDSFNRRPDSVMVPIAGRRSVVGEGYSVQIWLSINAVSCDLDNAPTLVASTEPFLNSISVGMPRTPYFGGVP